MDIIVDPQMLRWVRMRAGLRQDELARKVGVRPERVAQWESYGQLTLKQAEEVARTTHAPFGYLYLDEPPDETLPIPDFRTVGSKIPLSTSLDLREIIDISLARQDWYRNYAVGAGFAKLGFVGAFEGTELISEAAWSVSEYFGLETAARSEIADWEDVFELHRACLERRGVLVMRTPFAGEGTNRPLSVKEFRGFALTDDFAPLIFVNGRDYLAAQIFTLIHEVVHLFLGVSGISNLNRTYSTGQEIERFCNGVAAEILVPADELRAKVTDVGNITSLVQHFKVSRLVILRRLRDLELISRREFVARYRSVIAEFENEPARTVRGGAYYRTKIKRLGKPFLTALLSSTFEGMTSPTESMQLLGYARFCKSQASCEGTKGGKSLMAYLLDTNTFISAKNFHYGLDFCPGYWEWLMRENADGNVFSVHRVFEELCSQTDGLSEWVKGDGAGLFLPLDNATGIEMVRVANYISKLPPQYKAKSKNDFLNGADLILIACAIAHNHVVVTHETGIASDPMLTRVKIPNVCDQFGVDCMTPFQMLRKLGAGFSLMPKQEYILEEDSSLDEIDNEDDFDD